MTITHRWRRLAVAILAGGALSVMALAAPARIGGVTPAYAQVSAEFQEALESYGHWERHPRFGEVWVPEDLPPDWRPYEYGHWVYTDEWGWYWVSDPEEEDWGWVVYHYGRWARDGQFGWFWIPGDEWGPAWVDWRYGDDYVGWAPLPPDEMIDDYDEQPDYWVFIAPRYITAARPRSYFVPRNRHDFVFRRSHVVNRTLRFERGRAAVNPGVSPALIARATRRPLPTYRVSPHVLAGTQGVAGAVRVSPQQLRAGRPAQRGRKPNASHVNAVAVQATTTTIKPAATVVAPQPLGKNERGRLGTHPPRAAQGATVAPLPQQPAKPALPPQQQQQQQQQPVKPSPPPPQPAKPTPLQPAKPTPPPAVTPKQPPAAVTPPQQPRIERREQHQPAIAPQTPPPKLEQRPSPPAVTRPVSPPPPPPPPAAAKPAPPAAKQVPPPHPVQAPKPPPPKSEPPAKKAPGKPEDTKSEPPK